MKDQTEGEFPLTPAGFTPGPTIEPVRFEPFQLQRGRKLFRARPRTLLISAALLICALLAGYIVTGKAVYLSTDPADAQIEISGGWQLKLADRFLLREGDYQLQATAPGYHPLHQILTVNEKQNQQYAYTLRPLPGHLQIDTVPVIAAEIRIDNTVRGQTPTTLTPLEPGTYTIEVLADRYLPYETAVTIEGKDQQQSLTAELKAAWGDVRLETLPVGADVYVDDQLAGQTPLTAEILQGEHNLRIKLAGYKDWRKAVRVTAGEAQQLTAIQLEQADAVVQINTRPAGASVTVDGEYKGISPLEIALTPGKAATIRLFSQGYAQSVQKINAKSGDSRTLNIELQQEIAEVRILADPADAEVYIDGKPQGLADQTVELSTTPHTVEIRKAGYLDYKTTITPRPGIAQQVSARLKSIEQAKRDAVRTEISSPGGQKLKLFEAVAITMGASRREPGRRANETIRNVQFTRPFYLSLTEVTNAEFRQFDSQHTSSEVQGHDLNGDKQPVVNITWEQVALYCNWLSEKATLTPFYLVKDNKVTGFNPAANGYRLPTEAEWEWAARDQGNTINLKFAWGDALPPAPKSGNYADVSAAPILAIIQAEYTDGSIVTAPVASFTPNQKGLYDIGGNVAEWTHDFYDINMAEEGSTSLDSLGADSGEHHVIRGASWSHGSVTELRLSFRDYGKDKRNDVGFRIARYLE